MVQKAVRKKRAGRFVRLSPLLLLGPIMLVSTYSHAFANAGGAAYGETPGRITGQFMAGDCGFHVVGISRTPSQCSWRDGGACTPGLSRVTGITK